MTRPDPAVCPTRTDGGPTPTPVTRTPTLMDRVAAALARVQRPVLAGPGGSGHVVRATGWEGLSFPIGDDGILIGEDPTDHPQLIQLRRCEPYPVVLVGGLWSAQILVLRICAAGIRVAVETARARAWAGLAAACASAPNPVTLHAVGDVPALAPGPENPALLVRDCGARPPRSSAAAAPWCPLLTLLPHLSPAAPRLLRTAALVGLQRLSPAEAEQTACVLGLTPHEAGLLPQLTDDATLWCSGLDRRHITTKVADVETGLLGNPRRIDRPISNTSPSGHDHPHHDPAERPRRCPESAEPPS